MFASAAGSNVLAPANGHGVSVEPSAGIVTATPVLPPKQLPLPLPS